MGLCYLKLKNYKLGKKFLKKAIRIDSTNESAWIELIDLYLKDDNYRYASYLIDKAISSNQESMKILKKSFEINYKKGLFIQAIKNVENLIELGDLKWNNWKNIIKCLIKIKSWDKALKTGLKA